MIFMLKDRLKQARKAARKTQKQVAEAVGMTQPSYSELETGQSQGSALLPKIAMFLGVNVHWLDSGEGAMTAPDALDNPNLSSLIQTLHNLHAENKLPPELIVMLQNTVETVVNIQDNKEKLTAGQAPVMKKQA